MAGHIARPFLFLLSDPSPVTGRDKKSPVSPTGTFLHPSASPSELWEAKFMKTPKIVGELENRAGRQLNLLLGAI
jgi:hypothetical protein